MSDLVVIVYPTEAKAEELRKKVFDLQKEYLIEVGDAAIAVKQADGNVKLNQLFNTTAAGAAFTAMVRFPNGSVSNPDACSSSSIRA